MIHETCISETRFRACLEAHLIVCNPFVSSMEVRREKSTGAYLSYPALCRTMCGYDHLPTCRQLHYAQYLCVELHVDCTRKETRRTRGRDSENKGEYKRKTRRTKVEQEEGKNNNGKPRTRRRKGSQGKQEKKNENKVILTE